MTTDRAPTDAASDKNAPAAESSMMVDGQLRTLGEISAAFDAALLLVRAFAESASDNGGDGEPEWEKISQAHDIACGAFSEAEHDEIQEI